MYVKVSRIYILILIKANYYLVPIRLFYHYQPFVIHPIHPFYIGLPFRQPLNLDNLILSQDITPLTIYSNSIRNKITIKFNNVAIIAKFYPCNWSTNEWWPMGSCWTSITFPLFMTMIRLQITIIILSVHWLTLYITFTICIFLHV